MAMLAKMAKVLLCLAVGPLLVGCAKPNSELPMYQLPLSGGASVRPAIIEGILEQVSRGGGLPTVLSGPYELYEPGAVDQFCAYVFSIDGQVVGDRADCTAAVPITPGKHTIAARLQADRYSRRGGKRTFNPSRATLMFDAEEGHRYKISMDTPSSNAAYPRRVWITDLITQTSVTEAALVTPNSPEGVPRWEPGLRDLP